MGLSKFLIFVFILIFGQNRSVKPVNSTVLPVTADLPIYLRALERISQSAGTPVNEVDANFALGLFLANVNLKSAIVGKNGSLPFVLKVQTHKIMKTNRGLTGYFKYMRSLKLNNYEITYLIVDEDSWAGRVQKFYNTSNSDIEEFSRGYLYEEYSSWVVYENRVMDYENNVPNAEQSDACMVTLTMNPVRLGSPSYKCSTTSACLSYVENGSDFGYALIHRVLFLLVAYYSRGCYVFTPQLDSALVDKLCATTYEEANYIAMNKFRLPDLLMEQISICSLAGHKQFLQRKWFKTLLKLQTPLGCFTTQLHTVYNRLNRQKNYRSLVCDGHVNGVAAASLSAVIRYILETYF